MHINVTAQQHVKIIREILTLRREIIEDESVTVELIKKLDRGVNFEKCTDSTNKEQIDFAKHSLNLLMNNEVLHFEILRNDYAQLSSRLLKQMLDKIENQLICASDSI